MRFNDFQVYKDGNPVDVVEARAVNMARPTILKWVDEAAIQVRVKYEE